MPGRKCPLALAHLTIGSTPTPVQHMYLSNNSVTELYRSALPLSTNVSPFLPPKMFSSSQNAWYPFVYCSASSSTARDTTADVTGTHLSVCFKASVSYTFGNSL